MELAVMSVCRAARCARLRLLTTAVALLCGAVFLHAATFGTSSYLQVNLSFMPFSYYDTSHAAASYTFSEVFNGTTYSSCPAGASVRGCFQTILGQLYAQGVSGVRVFVKLCDTTSMAFYESNGTTSMCGMPWQQVSWSPSTNSVQATWIANVGNFFQDVINSGITNIHITTGGAPMNLTQASSAASSPLGACSTAGNCCPDTPSTIYFNAFAPFGYTAVNGNVIGDIYANPNPGNRGYNCSPVNPFFIGWANYFNVINAMLAKAHAAQNVTYGSLNVFGLEIQQEMNPNILPALIRYIYDNSIAASAPSQFIYTRTIDEPPSGSTYQVQVADVLAGLRAQMSANGFDPGRVVYSSAWTDSTVYVAPPGAQPNCPNAWEDYARNWSQDGITQAINAYYVGEPDGASAIDGLTCYGTLDGTMQTSPMYSTQPDIVDFHIYPQVDSTQNTDAMIQNVAAVDYGDVPHFLVEAGLQSATIVIGETYGGVIDVLNQGSAQAPDYCFGGQYSAPVGAPSDNVAGFNDETVSGNNPLSSYTVTVRPWMELEDPDGICFSYGSGPGTPGNFQTVNYNGQGPYIPTIR